MVLGASLMHHLETVYVASDRDMIDTRLPVQFVVRPKSEAFHGYRGYAGQVAGGVLRMGDDVDIDAMMVPDPLRTRRKLAIKHTTRKSRAVVKDVQYRLDINALHRDQDATELGLNEIGRVTLRTTQPLLCDDYATNRATGSFILIDEATGATVGGGMISS